MATREQNWTTVDELRDEMGISGLITELIKYQSLDDRNELITEICNLWDVNKLEELDNETILSEIVTYYDSSYIQEVLDDIKNLWI